MSDARCEFAWSSRGTAWECDEPAGHTGDHRDGCYEASPARVVCGCYGGPHGGYTCEQCVGRR